MYNGLEAVPIKGTGLSGYVQRSKATVSSNLSRLMMDDDDRSPTDFINPLVQKRTQKENDDLAQRLASHKAVRAVHLKVALYREERESRGEDAATVDRECGELYESLITAARQELWDQQRADNKKSAERFAAAFGVKTGGDAFDRAKVEEEKRVQDEERRKEREHKLMERLKKMGASCCSSQTVASDAAGTAPDTLPPISHHNSESRRKKRSTSALLEPTTPNPVLVKKPIVTVSVPTLGSPVARLPAHVPLDPALELLTDTFAVSATTLSEADDVGEDASSWVDVSLLTHSMHPHPRSVSDVASDADLASWDPRLDWLRAGQRREWERFMRAEADSRARIAMRMQASWDKIVQRGHKEAFMRERSAILRQFFLERCSIFMEACAMQADVGRPGIEREEADEWVALMENTCAPSTPKSARDADITTPPDQITRTSKTLDTLDDALHPFQSLTATMESDPLSSSFGDMTSSAVRSSANGSSGSARHIDPRSVVYGKAVARVEQTKQPERLQSPITQNDTR